MKKKWTNSKEDHKNITKTIENNETQACVRRSPSLLILSDADKK